MQQTKLKHLKSFGERSAQMAEVVENTETKKREIESSTHISIGKSGSNMYSFERNVSLSKEAFDQIRAIVAEDVAKQLQEAESEAEALMVEMVASIEKLDRTTPMEQTKQEQEKKQEGSQSSAKRSSTAKKSTTATAKK